MTKLYKKPRPKYKKYRKTTRNFDDPKYKAWRLKIYNRDNFTCQWPGCNSKNRLNAHHIHKWAIYPSLRFYVDNGITLCYRHHHLIKNNEDNYIVLFSDIIRKKKKHV